MHNDIRSYNIAIFENTMAKIKDDASSGRSSTSPFRTSCST